MKLTLIPAAVAGEAIGEIVGAAVTAMEQRLKDIAASFGVFERLSDLLNTGR